MPNSALIGHTEPLDIAPVAPQHPDQIEHGEALDGEPLGGPPRGVPTMQLPANLSITDAAALRNALCEAIGLGTLTLDASRVERIDTAALQLLLAARRAAHDANRWGGWQAPSPALARATALLGLSAELDL